MTTETVPANVARAREQSRFMQYYAKHFAAGAFATPTGKEILADPWLVADYLDGSERVITAWRVINRPSWRADFTGLKFELPAGTRIVTHLARTPAAVLPDLTMCGAVTVYAEDRGACDQLLAQGFKPGWHLVSAASELKTVYVRPPLTGRAYPPEDLATAVPMPYEATPAVREALLAEALGASGWDDDFPYYSDGSWSALNLRGFYHDDPGKGVKPSEMPRTWKTEHPADLDLACDWTVLGEAMAEVRSHVEDLARRNRWTGLERVRLLKMAGRGGKGGKLARHTDITDKAAGLADGQIARFHVPLVTDPAIRMSVWELDGTRRDVHLPAWSCWYLDARKPHAVTNPTGLDRIHLVIDVVSNHALRAQIANAYEAARS